MEGPYPTLVKIIDGEPVSDSDSDRLLKRVQREIGGLRFVSLSHDRLIAMTTGTGQPSSDQRDTSKAGV